MKTKSQKREHPTVSIFIITSSTSVGSRQVLYTAPTTSSSPTPAKQGPPVPAPQPEGPPIPNSCTVTLPSGDELGAAIVVGGEFTAAAGCFAAGLLIPGVGEYTIPVGIGFLAAGVFSAGYVYENGQSSTVQGALNAGEGEGAMEFFHEIALPPF